MFVCKKKNRSDTISMVVVDKRHGFKEVKNIGVVATDEEADVIFDYLYLVNDFPNACNFFTNPQLFVALHDQNDINESTCAQLDAISTALSELQA